MARFFRQAGDSDSDTESSEDELMSSDEEAPAAKPAAKPAMSRFLKGAASDSSSSSDSDSDSDEDDESDVPKKIGWIYASVLIEKLRQWPDIFPPNTRSSVNVAHLLYGLEDVEGLEGLRYRNRSNNAYGDVRTQLGLAPVGRTPKVPRAKRPLLLANWTTVKVCLKT